MAKIIKSVKFDTDKDAALLRWLEDNEIVFSRLVIHLLNISMLIGNTDLPPGLVEKTEGKTVLPEDEDLSAISAIADFLEGI